MTSAANWLNAQWKVGSDGRITRGIEYTHVWGPKTGFTLNPFVGCDHGCGFVMPDGNEAICYADTITRAFPALAPEGFAHVSIKLERLEALKTIKGRAGIFINSMSDFMSKQIPDDAIKYTLDECAKYPNLRIMILTKNAPRLLTFQYPSNVWVGCSMPPSIWRGRTLSNDDQRRMFVKILESMAALPAGTMRWLSAEPLSWDISELLLDHLYLKQPRESWLDWCIIGAASHHDGKRTNLYQPEQNWVDRLMVVLKHMGTPVFFKGNLYPNWTEQRPEQFPIKFLEYEDVHPKTGKMVTMLPFGGSQEFKTAPILDCVGKPIDPRFEPDWLSIQDQLNAVIDAELKPMREAKELAEIEALSQAELRRAERNKTKLTAEQKKALTRFMDALPVGSQIFFCSPSIAREDYQADESVIALNAFYWPNEDIIVHKFEYPCLVALESDQARDIILERIQSFCSKHPNIKLIMVPLAIAH